MTPISKKTDQKIPDRIKLVDIAVKEIKDKYGEGAIMKLGEARRVDVDVIPTGSISLDIALGVMGMPRGRVVEIYGPESSGKCVKSDTIVFSQLGMLPISAFGNLDVPEFQEKEIFVHSEHSYEKTSHFYNGGFKPTIKIKTNYGYELEGTPNHRVKVLDKDGDYLFRRLDSLQSTDHIAIQRNQNCFGKGVYLNDFGEKVWPRIKSKMNTSKKDFSNFKITDDLAKLIGYMIGDGTCTDKGFNKNNIQITVGDSEIENDLRRVCLKIFKEFPKITPDKRNRNVKRFVIHNSKARAFLYYAGLGWWKAEDKEIPWSIMMSPDKIVASFLSTLFESDGGIHKDTIEYSSRSEKLVRQIQIVLLNFGIISKIVPRFNKNYKRFYYHLYIDGQNDRKIFTKEIGFVSKRKQKKLVQSLNKLKMFNTNRDVIPSINRKLDQFLSKYRDQIKGTNRADWKVFSDYLPQTPGYSKISYDRLDRILKRFSDGNNLPEYQELESLYSLGFFWDKVRDVKKSSAYVFDFTVPVNATFVGNGFVNHNTTLALHIVAEAQKQGGQAAFVDAEHALDPEYAKKIGVQIDNLLISQPDYGEQALEIVETLIKSGAMDVIVVDSVAALTPRAEIEGEMGQQHVGLQARLMSHALRKLTAVIAKSKTVLIFINQIRHQIGIFFGNPEITPGGKALKFYSSVRIDVRRIAQVQSGEKIIGGRHRAKVVKNKVAPPFRQAEFDILYNEGISKFSDLVNSGVKYGILARSGAWYNFDKIKLGQGLESARSFLKDNGKLSEEISKKIVDAASKEESI